MEKKQTHLVYGLIAGILMVAVALIIHITKTTFVTGVGFLSYLPLLVLLFMNAYAYSKVNDGYVTFGNIFGSCFKATLISSVCMLIWGIIILVAFPEMKEQAIQMAREKAAQNPKATDEVIDMAVSFVEKGYAAFVILGAILGPMFWGALIGVIAAAVAPKKGVRPIANDNF